MATTQQPRLIKYNDKDYDFNTLQQTVLNNYDKYARQFGYGRSKYEKDRQGLVEILQQMQKDQSVTVNPYQIEFSDSWNTEKGTFGKPRNKSRHYQNPAWMIINTLQGMDVYNPDADKKKINDEFLRKEFQDRISGVGFENLNEENKKTVINNAISHVLNYENIPDGYILEEGFNPKNYYDQLRALQSALGTTDNLSDDQLAYYNLGISNPNKPKEPEQTAEQKAYNEFKEEAYRSYIFNENTIQDLWQQEKKKKEAEFRKRYDGTSSSDSSNDSSSQSSDSSSSQNVTATSSQQQSPPAAQNPPADEQEKPKQETPPETYSTAKEIVDKHNLKPKQKFNWNDKGWIVNNQGIPRESREGKYKGKGVKEFKNGAKFQVLKKLKKYDGGGVSEYEYPEEIDNLSMLPMFFTKGPAGLFALAAQTGLQSSKMKKLYDAYKNNDISSEEFYKNLAQAITLVGTQGLGTFSTRIKDKNFKQKQAAHNAAVKDVNAAKQQKVSLEGKVTELKSEKAKLEKEYKDAKAAFDKNPTDAALKTASDEAKAKLDAFDNSTITNAETALNNYNPKNSTQELLSDSYAIQLNKNADELKMLRSNYYNPYIYANGALAAYVEDQMIDDTEGSDYRYLIPYGIGIAKAGWNKFKNPSKNITDEILTVGEESAPAAATSSATAASTKPSFWDRLKNWRKGSSGTAAILTGAGVGASIPSSSQAGTMTDLYSTGGAGDLYYDENGNLRQIGGFTVEQRPEGPELAAWNTNGVRIEPMLQGVTSTGKMNDRLRELRMYIDPETGRSMIPGVNMQKVLNDPELHQLVLNSGATFDGYGRYVGEITPARTDLAYNNPLARAGRRVAADLHGTGGSPSPLTGYPAAAAATLGLTAAPWGTIGKGLGILGTASLANDAINMLKTNPEVYRWQRRDNNWNLGNMYLPYNEYKP